MPEHLEGLILAGGNSRRMGQDKALLLRDSYKTSSNPSNDENTNGQPEPLLVYLCRVALEVCEPVYVLSPRCDRYGPLLPAGCCCLPESRTAHATPPGPLVAFAEGLSQLQADWVLLLACDLPGITPELLRAWTSRLPAAPAGAIALLPQGPKGWEPLCGFYRRDALNSLQGAIAQGERSFQRWLAKETVERLPVPSNLAIQNCNTPEDWAQFQQGRE